MADQRAKGVTAAAIRKGCGDTHHSAGLFMARETWERGKVTKTTGNDGKPYTKKEMPGEVDGKAGVFEAGMVPGTGEINHAFFRKQDCGVGLSGPAIQGLGSAESYMVAIPVPTDAVVGDYPADSPGKPLKISVDSCLQMVDEIAQMKRHGASDAGFTLKSNVVNLRLPTEVCDPDLQQHLPQGSVEFGIAVEDLALRLASIVPGFNRVTIEDRDSSIRGISGMPDTLVGQGMEWSDMLLKAVEHHAIYFPPGAIESGRDVMQALIDHREGKSTKPVYAQNFRDAGGIDLRQHELYKEALAKRDFVEHNAGHPSGKGGLYIQAAVRSVKQSEDNRTLIFEPELDVVEFAFDDSHSSLSSKSGLVGRSKDDGLAIERLKEHKELIEAEPWSRVHCTRVRIAGCIDAILSALAPSGLEIVPDKSYTATKVKTIRSFPALANQSRASCLCGVETQIVVPWMKSKGLIEEKDTIHLTEDPSKVQHWGLPIFMGCIQDGLSISDFFDLAKVPKTEYSADRSVSSCPARICGGVAPGAEAGEVTVTRNANMPAQLAQPGVHVIDGKTYVCFPVRVQKIPGKIERSEQRLTLLKCEAWRRVLSSTWPMQQAKPHSLSPIWKEAIELMKSGRDSKSVRARWYSRGATDLLAWKLTTGQALDQRSVLHPSKVGPHHIIIAISSLWTSAIPANVCCAVEDAVAKAGQSQITPSGDDFLLLSGNPHLSPAPDAPDSNLTVLLTANPSLAAAAIAALRSLKSECTDACVQVPAFSISVATAYAAMVEHLVDKGRGMPLDAAYFDRAGKFLSCLSSQAGSTLWASKARATQAVVAAQLQHSSRGSAITSQRLDVADSSIASLKDVIETLQKEVKKLVTELREFRHDVDARRPRQSLSFAPLLVVAALGAARLVIDILGGQWALVALDGAHVMVCALGLCVAGKKKSSHVCLRRLCLTWLMIWAIANIMVIFIHLGIAPANWSNETTVLTLGQNGDESWWCEPGFEPAVGCAEIEIVIAATTSALSIMLVLFECCKAAGGSAQQATAVENAYFLTPRVGVEYSSV